MKKKLAWLGIPFDEYSSYMQGPAKAPDLIFQAFHSDSTNYYTENLHDIEHDERISFAGIIPVKTYDDIYSNYQNQLKLYEHIIGIGGDHSITYPILKAYAEIDGPINLLQFDAHPDLYDQLDGNSFSHACPFARSHEDGIINQHIQIGIRSHTPFQISQCEKYNIIQFQMKDYPWPKLDISGNWYVSLDLDVLDPAFAPGISHYEPGGMDTRTLLNMIQGLKVKLIGADIVEYNPIRDYNGMTAAVAAKLLKELSSKILLGPT